MMEGYPTHLGHVAPTCPLRITVRAHPMGTSSNGYSCQWTGGHCLPDVNCESFITEYKVETELGELVKRIRHD